MTDVPFAAAAQTHRLRGRYGTFLLVILVGQLIIADVLMYLYAAFGQKSAWDVPASVMQTWLGATVVQLIGLVYVVVSHLFPREQRRGGGSDGAQT